MGNCEFCLWPLIYPIFSYVDPDRDPQHCFNIFRNSYYKRVSKEEFLILFVLPVISPEMRRLQEGTLCGHAHDHKETVKEVYSKVIIYY